MKRVRGLALGRRRWKLTRAAISATAFPMLPRKRLIIFLLLSMAACDRAAPAPPPVADTLEPGIVAPDGCADEDSIIAGLRSLETSKLPESTRQLLDEAQGKPTRDTPHGRYQALMSRQNAKVYLATRLLLGTDGLPQRRREAFCVLRQRYDDGNGNAAIHLGQLYERAGQQERAAYYYGAAFGYDAARERSYIEQKIEPDAVTLEPTNSHYEWGAMNTLMRANLDQQRTLYSVFKDGAGAGNATYRREREAEQAAESSLLN